MRSILVASALPDSRNVLKAPDHATRLLISPLIQVKAISQGAVDALNAPQASVFATSAKATSVD